MALIGLANGAGPISHGSYTVVAGDDTANTVDIDTKLSSVTTAVVQVIRAGKVATGDAAVSFAAGVLTVANGATYVLTTGDVLNWIAVGK
jgi:hypothetical protein